MGAAKERMQTVNNFIAPCTLALCAAAVLVLNPAHAQTDAPAAVGDAARPGAYYVSEFEVTDAEGIRPYSAAVEATFQPYGGRYVVRGGKVAPLEGAPTQRLIMIAFPSMERAQAWYDSEAYRALRPIRQRSANSRVFILGALPN
jgi:uncharacterized protein (DUF1330 family)